MLFKMLWHPAWQSAFQASLGESILQSKSCISCSQLFSFSSISGRKSLLRGCDPGSELFKKLAVQLFKHLWKSLSCIYPAWQSAFQASLESCMAVYPGRVYPAWQSAFQASLEESILHGCELFKHLVGQGLSSTSGTAYGCELFKHLWKSLSCMAVSFSSISGRVYPAWQSPCQASLEESILAVSFSSISGRVYPAWQSAFQASLEESILHGCEIFKHLVEQPILDGCELFKHLWKSLSCMAVSFSSISGRVYPAWQSPCQASLEESILAVSFSSISGRVYPAWQSAFQASLEESILHGCELFKHLWKKSILHGHELFKACSGLFKHLWKSLSCMALSLSGISGRVYPAWQSAFQASLEESTLHGSKLFKHLWKNISRMAVSFSSNL